MSDESNEIGEADDELDEATQRLLQILEPMLCYAIVHGWEKEVFLHLVESMFDIILKENKCVSRQQS